MSTATSTSRPPASQPARAPGVGGGGGGGGPGPSGGVAIDPIRLLRKYYPLLIIAAVIGGVLGVGAFFLFQRFAPSYTATATFACFPQTLDPRAPAAFGQGQDELSRFMGTQMALMVSNPILEKVIRDPEVEGSEWAKAYSVKGQVQSYLAIPALEKDLTVRGVAQSNLLRLSMTDKNALDARKIVEAVTKVYQEDLRGQGNRESVERREVLNRQIVQLDQQMRDLNASRDRLLQDNSITDLNTAQTTEVVRVQRINEQYIGAVQSLTSVRSRLERFQAMLAAGAAIDFPNDLREAANRDPIVSNLDSQIANLRTDYATLRAQGYGAEHPTVQAVNKRIEATEHERDDKLNIVLRKLFDSEVDGLRASADSLVAQIDKLKSELEDVNKRKEDLLRISLRLGELEREIDTKKAERVELDAARRNLEIIGGNSVFDRVRLIVPAQTPQQMSFPKLQIFLPLGVVLITGLVAGAVLLREVLDQRVRGPADLGAISRIRILGIVPDAQEDPSKPQHLPTAFRDAPAGALAEAFRLLRPPVAKAMDQHGHKTLLVLAGMPGSGGSTVASNLALACAGAEDRVLIIDANLRRPTMHKIYQLSDGPGLGDCLAGQSTLEAAVRPTSVAGVSLLSAGSVANRAMPERLASESMGRLLADAAARYDRVIVDAPPAIVSGDGFALANRVNAVVLVVRAMSEKRGLVNRVRSQLGEARSEFLGVVVNAVRASAGGYLRGNIKATHEYQNSDA